jgi:nicotinamide-nucleotide amidase
MSNQNIAVLAIGSEILDGRVLDTNTNFIAQELTKLGLSLKISLICDDDELQIVDSLKYLSSQASFIIVSGGLGPTTDDLTRESIAKFTGKPLEERPESVQRLISLYEKRKRTFDPSNLKQAIFPNGSHIIANDVGTAEGFHIIHNNLEIFSVPGVPKELKPMWYNYVLPKLTSKIKFDQIYRESFRIFGLPESVVGQTINSLGLPNSITVSYRAHFPEIHVVIKGTNQDEVLNCAKKSKDAIQNEYIFIENQELSLPETVCELLASANVSVSVAESCTGGLLGSYLTNTAGASRYFSGGYITYANDRKIQDLNVPKPILAAYGAVSEDTAKAMADGCRQKTGTDFGLSITGIAGPDGGSEDKPVGTFYVGLSSASGTFANKYFFLSDRKAVRVMAAYRALETLRRVIKQI